jgi:dolichol-phosphate mannosyltransferase
MIPEVSIVVPVFNEAEAAPALAREIIAAFARRPVEILFVDDASTDGTAAALAAIPEVSVLRHARNAGQSRAIRTGVMAARALIIVTLDGDGQNDPADAPALAEALSQGPPQLGMVAGERRERRDSASKRWASRLANGLRRRVLNDGASDTGCGLKAIRREVYLRLPYFDHQHRYLPALVKREGFDVAFRPVNHRPRLAGVSKYNNLGRLWVGLSDLAGVAWLLRRARDPGEALPVQQHEP